MTPQPTHLLILKCNIVKQLPNCRVFVSKPTIRINHVKGNLTLRNVNKPLETLVLKRLSTLNSQHLNRKGLHLNSKGKGRHMVNFVN